MIETIVEEENNKQKELKNQFEDERENTKNHNVEKLESMKHDLIKKIEELDKEFEVNFNRYVNETEGKSKEYKSLLSENETASDKINKDMRKINRLKQQI
jgi:DNA anti-recombination protein RmuC